MIALACMTALTLAASHVPSDAQLVAHVKRLPGNRIDSQLGGQPYETWLHSALGPAATIRWEADDCGEGGDGADPVPICVTADTRLSPHGHVVVSIAVGSSDSGIVGKPEFFFGRIEGLGPTEILGKDQLHLLSSKLHQAQRLDARLARLADRPLDESAMIRELQRLPASRLGPGLPDSTFADWMTARAGPHAELKWLVEGCGHNGPPVTLTGTNDEWAFVDASFDDPAVRVLIRIRVGTCRKGAVGAPLVTDVSVFDKRPGHIRIQRTSLDRLTATLRELRH